MFDFAPAGPTDPGWTWSNTVAVAALLVALLSLFFAWRNDKRARAAETRAERAEQRADAAHDLAKKADDRQERAERRAAVRWVIEPDPGFKDWYKVRNIGVERAEDVKIDAESVAPYSVNTIHLYSLDPNESAQFELRPGRIGLPDDIRLTWGPFDDRQSAAVAFPHAQPAKQTTSEAE